MTLETQIPRVSIVGNGTLGPYNLNDENGQAIRFVSTSHVMLTRYATTTSETGTVLVLNTDYTVGGTQDARTFTLIGSQAVLASTQRIIAERNQTYVQDLDLTTGGAYNAESQESRHDKVAEYLQEVKTLLARKVEASPLDATPSTVPLKANATAGNLLVYDANKNLIPVAPTDVGITALLLGAGWSPLLQLPVSGVLDDLAGIRIKTTYAAMTSMPANELTAGGVVCTLYRTVLNDGGFGFWRVVAGSDYTANGGTVLDHDTEDFQFQRFTEGWVSLEMFGGGTVAAGIASNTAAYNAWVGAVIAGFAPNTLRLLRDGTYHFETEPVVLEDRGRITIYADGISAVVRRGWTSADPKEAVFHALGATQLVIYGLAAGTAAGGSYGGAIVTLEAKANSAPDFSIIDGCYFTSYGVAPIKVISAATAAAEAVFTSAGHGYTNGQQVVYLYGLGGTWATMSHQLFDVSDVTTDTFKLKYPGTSTYFDSSGLGTYTANSATVKEGLCTDYPIVIDGSARTNSPIGIRGARVTHSQVFGGRLGSILINGAIGLELQGTTTSDAGWNGEPLATGTASVPNFYIKFDSGSISGLNLDRCYYTTITGQIQGRLVETANTFYTNALGPIGSGVTRAGTQNSGPDFIWLGGGMAFQKRAITGVTGSYAAFTWPVAFRSAPGMYGAQAYNSSSTAAACVVNAISATSVEVSGQNLHASGLAIIWAIGEI